MADVKITVVNNGPLLIEGEVEVVDQEGHAFGLGGRTKIGLCRCGFPSASRSATARTRRSTFQSVVQAHELPPPPAKS